MSQYFRNAQQRSLRNKLKPNTEDAMLMGTATSKAYAASQVGQDYKNLSLPLTDEQKARDELKDFGGRRRHKKTNFRKKRRSVRYTRKRCKKRR